MNLYLISQDEQIGYETYDSAVVCAKDVEAARRMPPSPRYDSFEDCKYVWATDPEHVRVQFIGVALPSLSEGVICASFNAG